MIVKALNDALYEPVEEEKNTTQILASLRLIEERGSAVLMLDYRLAKLSTE